MRVGWLIGERIMNEDYHEMFCCPDCNPTEEITNEEVLSKATAKALKNGWKPALKEYRFKTVDRGYARYIEPIIFDHEFAKALWGDDDISNCCVAPVKEVDIFLYECSKCDNLLVDGDYSSKAWKWHLQQMVISVNPIKYLKKHI